MSKRTYWKQLTQMSSLFIINSTFVHLNSISSDITFTNLATLEEVYRNSVNFVRNITISGEKVIRFPSSE